MSKPFILVTPATRGLSLALTRHLLRTSSLPVYATHRQGTESEVHKSILSTASLSDVDPKRLTVLPLELTSESSIKGAADALAEKLPDGSFLHTGFFTGGILHPEKQPADIDLEMLQKTFQINVFSHLLLIKHFSRFLPSTHPSSKTDNKDSLSKWVHISARVGSIADNRKGGWYSYRSSKAALNQVIKTFDNQLKMKKTSSICVGIHPGTVKTDLSKGFWDSQPEDQLFEPEQAVEKIIKVVRNIQEEQRGKVWDHAGKEVPW